MKKITTNFRPWTIQALLFLLFIISCTNETVKPVFKKPVLEVISVYGINNTISEANINLTEVFQTVSELGVVWSEKQNPTVTDNLLFDKDVKYERDSRFEMPNLQKGKTYFLKAFYKLNNEIVYSPEVQFTQNFDGVWQRLASPTGISPEEYISPDGVGLSNGPLLYVFCEKVNRLTDKQVGQVYFEGEWNPNFGQPRQLPVYRQKKYNQFVASFPTGNDILTLVGGGYQQLPRNAGRIYFKSMCLYPNAGCGWRDYPGADVPTSSFGIGPYPYVLENTPNGQLWKFDLGIVQWVKLSQFPTAQPARLIALDAGERAFILVEPENINSPAKELYEYLPDENRWERKMDFAGEDRRKSVAFVINNRLFFGLGQATKDSRGLRDIWEYVVAKNTWQKVANYPGGGTIDNLATGNNQMAVIGFGQRYNLTSIGGEDYWQTNDFWAFKPQ